MGLIYKMLLILVLFNGLSHDVDVCTKPGSNNLHTKGDSILHSKTAIIDGKKYTAINTYHNETKRRRFDIKNQKGEIVYKGTKEEGIAIFKFVDFNNDGYKDIVLDLDVADSGELDLVLYDPKLKKFVLAGNCSNAEKILHTPYYFSYQDCCMGREWNSELFYITNSKIVGVGHITYSDGDGLFFYKLDGKKKTLIKRWRVRINGDTPITTGPHIDFDLKRYWTMHWRNFISVTVY